MTDDEEFDELEIELDAHETPAGIRDSTGDVVLLFDDNTPQFCRGFEAGQVWGLMTSRGLVAFECYIREPNIEMVWRMAASRGYQFRTVAEEPDGFIKVRFLREGYEYGPDGEPRALGAA